MVDGPFELRSWLALMSTIILCLSAGFWISSSSVSTEG